MYEETFKPGDKTLFTIDAPTGPYGALFEDDGDTGYFYAFDLRRQKNRILDAVHIYNVANVVDRSRPSTLHIAWSDDGFKCALLINGYSHAAFDFVGKRGYCRTNFPNFPDTPENDWLMSDHSWSDDAVAWLPNEDLL
jgi:hypothetical protein